MMDLIIRFTRDEAAASSVEYAILVAFIALVIVGSITTLGTTLSGVYGNMAGKLEGS
jgi:pilus assembly protein Flp/PilA